MKTYFDSSALIAAIVEEEAHHSEALEALASVEDGFTSSHSLAEVFGVLTGGRMPIQISPAEAVSVIDATILERVDARQISIEDYRAALSRCQSAGARGGAVFDMLHLEIARRDGAARIFTINVRHFQAFAPDLRDIISLPSA